MTRARASLAALAMLLVLPLAACNGGKADDGRPESSRAFPTPDRPFSAPGGNAYSTEVERDRLNEAQTVMDMANIEPGMTVADIGAGAGYYTTRLSERVGPKGRVVAQDIDADALRQLGLRIERERLNNISIIRGEADDPRLPEASFDRVFLVHMYHEVSEPYAFLWRLRDALRKDARVIVVETDRAPDRHGMPPALLFCEFRAVGYRLGAFVRRTELNGYYARFDPGPDRPLPSEIQPCRMDEEVAMAAAGKGPRG